MRPADATNCINLTIFNLSSPCKILVAEEKAGGLVVRKIDDEGSRLREHVQNGAESLRFPAANVMLILQFPSAAIQFGGNWRVFRRFQPKANEEEKVCFT